jgi:CheY-like chemotaxis protein
VLTLAVETLRGLDYEVLTAADGPMAVTTLQAEANAAGHSWASVRRAADGVGVITRKRGMTEGWAWSLPADIEPDGEAEL